SGIGRFGSTSTSWPGLARQSCSARAPVNGLSTMEGAIVYRFIKLCVVFNLLSVTGLAQFDVNSRARAENPARSTVDLAEAGVGRGDLVARSVADCPELTKSFRVSAAGALSLPLLKEPVPVNGLVMTDLERAVARQLVQERLFVSPVVSAIVV